MRLTAALTLALALTACGRRPQIQRVDLDDVSDGAEPVLKPTPDSVGAQWTIANGGRGIHFGKLATGSLLSLACQISKDGAPPQLTVIRHARSQPGAEALFAVMGNGIVARLKLDAAHGDEGWRWEGRYPASARGLDVFTSQGDLDATLPGGGTLHVAGSGLPREFIERCRQNGKKSALPAAVKSSSPG